MASATETPQSTDSRSQDDIGVVDPTGSEPKSEATIAKLSSAKGIQNPIVVEWYSDKDASNPRNWSFGKKAWVVSGLCLYTFVVYCTASIVTPLQFLGMQKWNVSDPVMSLALSMYVVGCKFDSSPVACKLH